MVKNINLKVLSNKKEKKTPNIDVKKKQLSNNLIHILVM